MFRDKLGAIVVTPGEIVKVNSSLHYKKAGVHTGKVGGCASSNPEGAKWCIPAYGTVQTTDGGCLSFNSNQTSVPLPASVRDSWRAAPHREGLLRLEELQLDTREGSGWRGAGWVGRQ